ncbi:hypothetical protein FRB99_008769 [Tulasnella sp. 403]|nr:hypothetical protein FRB99_008769 [Tulasnella sp. 403]
MSSVAAQHPPPPPHNPQPTSAKPSAEMSSGDHSFEKFFEEVIASPELNLLDDVFVEDIDQKPHIHHSYPHMPHPILHRLQPAPPPSLNILKAHVQPNITPISSGGGISPTLTWSGDPSPIDQSGSPTLHDNTDLDAEDCKPVLFGPRPEHRRNSTGSRGRPSAAPSPPASRARTRSSKRSSSYSTAGEPGDDSSLQAHASSPSSSSAPTSPAAQLGRATTPRKKSRTLSSSRSSVSSIDQLISEVMNGGQPTNRLLPTGHRRNITSASLVPLDAPTQIRNYLTPSSTSKKEIPSAFVARRNKLKAKEVAVFTKAPAAPTTAGRKRTREEAGLKTEPNDDNEHIDELQDDDTPINASPSNSSVQNSNSSNNASPISELENESSSLLSAIEAKRRQNTLAARRSRQRKLDYVRNLEELVAALTRERDSWKTRAESAEKVLGYRPGEDEMDDDDDDE